MDWKERWKKFTSDFQGKFMIALLISAILISIPLAIIALTAF